MRIPARSVLVPVCLLAAFIPPTIDGQSSNVDSKIVPTESNTVVEVTVSWESSLRLLKKNQDGTEKEPFQDQHTRKYRTTSGFDRNDKPVVTMELMDVPGEPKNGHAHASKLSFINGHLQMSDKAGKQITPPFIPGNLDAGAAPYMSHMSGAKVFRVKDPSAFANHTSGTIQNPDENTAVITWQPSGRRDNVRTYTFQKSADGSWILAKTEFSAQSSTRTIHETTTYRVVREIVNSEGDARRRAAAPSVASMKEEIEKQKQRLDSTKDLLGIGKSRNSKPITQLTPLPRMTLPRPAMPTFVHSAPPKWRYAPRLGNVGFQGKPRLVLAGYQGPGANGANIVFVHGLNSNGDTWSDMQPWLNTDFTFLRSGAPTIGNGGRALLDSWVPDLDNALNLNYRYIAVGHSAGGLVSRADAQNANSPIYGVVTLDTPHLGSNLLTNMQVDAVNQFINYIASAGCYYDYTSCLTWSALGYGALAGGATLGVAIYAPATLDLESPNPYEIALNANPESFPRIGLVGISDPNWISFRTLIDILAGGPGSGQTAAAAAGYVDDGLYGIAYFYQGLADYYFWLWEEDDFDPYDGYGDLWDEYSYDSDIGFQLASDLESFDDWWRRTAECNVTGTYCDSLGSDGIVQGESQVYPNAPNFLMAGFDGSHSSSTRSQVSRAYLDQALSQQMFVPPAVCNSSAYYTANPGMTTISAPFQGGVYTFSVSDPGNCNWSSTGIPPELFQVDSAWNWLRFYGPSTGTTSGSVQVVVQLNRYGYRSNSVTIAGTTFTFDQDPYQTSPLGGLVLYGQPSGAVENLVTTVGGSSYTTPVAYTGGGADEDRYSTLVSAALAINADPASPVFASIERTDWTFFNFWVNTELVLVGKNAQAAGIPYDGSIVVPSGNTPDVSVHADSTNLQ